MNFNEQACTLLGIKATDKISLSQDEDDNDNWYLFKDADGFEVRAGYDKKGAMFNHSTMVKEVVKYFELDEEKTHNFLIAGQPTLVKGSKVEFWGIIAPAQ